MPAEPIDPDAGADDLFEMGAGRSVADPSPRADARRPLVAKVLALYRAAIRDGDTPEDLAARYVAATARGLAEYRRTHGGYPSWSLGDLDDLADEIDPPEAAP